VAALVTDLEPERTTIDLVNLGATERTVAVQAGTYGEHAVRAASYDADGQTRVVDPDARALGVSLPGGTRTTLELTRDRFANDPTYAPPWAV
jgi:hypothetical protein